ncbi:hypothetical protein GJ654_03200 [Rhodoblastus acidophilus]|uniref:SPOR domain-containing protein n=1 Tax=Rhodoblastus acidophilus TaxID=1074 RepID=A0A6N8DJG9_RHOAC|nr:SPOR domain-containing protein [Rhodoblastus acidophilus]MCW2273098.1 hypothetical protein [Rhodoblastus acidophilus]MTV29996.1 hypothetical protein [Rhodoblastus acidophilus]
MTLGLSSDLLAGMRAFIMFVLFMAAAPAALGGPLYWWVVLGSFNAETDGPLAADALRRRASRCDASVGTEYSSKMRGFRPGLVVTLTGPFPNRAAAERALDRVKPCAPDAYLKQAEEGGE